MMIAEESTSWPAVTGDTEQGGLGFTFKWDLGWMHDTLDYLSRNAVHRRFHQGELTFRAIYAAKEHFMLPLSHDEVVHGKGSALARMAGDEWVAWDDEEQSVLFGQRGSGGEQLLMVANFTPVPREPYDVVVSSSTTW